MGHHIMGLLFRDSTDSLKLRDDVDWPTFFRGRTFLTEHIAPDGWVPIEQFERLALAALSVHGAKHEWFRALGASAVDRLVDANPCLLVPRNPRESMMRFVVVRQSFFDYPILDLVGSGETRASLRVAYGLCPEAEQAAALSTAGFLARPLELCGATRIHTHFSSRSWAQDPHTVLELSWQPWQLH